MFSLKIKGLDIDRYHYVLLLISLNNELLTQKALCNILEVDKSYMVNIIDYLSSKGYVFREKDLTDGRQHLIKLTDKAKAAVPLIKKVISDLNKKSLEHLSENDIRIFNNVLLTIDNNLSEADSKNVTINYKK